MVRPEDAEPSIRGEVRLVDAETAETQDVHISAGAVNRYKEAYRQFNQSLADFAGQSGAGLIRLDVEADVVPQLATLLESKAYVA